MTVTATASRAIEYVPVPVDDLGGVGEFLAPRLEGRTLVAALAAIDDHDVIHGMALLGDLGQRPTYRAAEIVAVLALGTPGVAEDLMAGVTELARTLKFGALYVDVVEADYTIGGLVPGWVEDHEWTRLALRPAAAPAGISSTEWWSRPLNFDPDGSHEDSTEVLGADCGA
ncbi:hypothetical protein [Glycomyces buryatensis]|uniref:Uncharacterized protein n=1 Tax=Glycomyces buryatensis TaxID=2570927 RepID=A0A4S8Q636_9ACTN|nr:hypothetical protein [Glycomyces buryatensis]THV39628.1 hypothetical protein FAB82_17310 [Glycomyces buryatensis]